MAPGPVLSWPAGSASWPAAWITGSGIKVPQVASWLQNSSPCKNFGLTPDFNKQQCKHKQKQWGHCCSLKQRLACRATGSPYLGLPRFDFANSTNVKNFRVHSRECVPLSASLLHSPNNIIPFLPN